jgi:hypothetical protein
VITKNIRVVLIKYIQCAPSYDEGAELSIYLIVPEQGSYEQTSRACSRGKGCGSIASYMSTLDKACLKADLGSCKVYIEIEGLYP